MAAQLTGATADASRLAGDDVLVRADLTERTPLFVGSDPSEGATADVVAGVVHVAAPFDDRIRLRTGDVEIEPRPAFGVTTAFDIAQPAHGDARVPGADVAGAVAGAPGRAVAGGLRRRQPGPFAVRASTRRTAVPTRRSSISTSCRRRRRRRASRARCSVPAWPGDPTSEPESGDPESVGLDEFDTGPCRSTRPPTMPSSAGHSTS